jgi:hypothetical protein
MTQQAELFRKIDNLSPKHFNEVYDFVGYLQHKQQNELKNTEPKPEDEKKFSIPKNSDGKFILSKEIIEEMAKNSPTLHKLTGIIHSDMTLEQIREERLAKYLK